MNWKEAFELVETSGIRPDDASDGIRIVKDVLNEFKEAYGDQVEGPFFSEPESGWKYEYEVYRLVDMIVALDLIPKLFK